MEITFLGTGTSTGVPEIGCQCEVCTSSDKRDWRLRTSVLVETDGKRILLDCGPDFRWQVIRNKTYRLDAVLISHEHYDHVGGLDAYALFAVKREWMYMRKIMWRKLSRHVSLMCSVPINIPEFRTWNFTGSETSLLWLPESRLRRSG